MTWLCFALALWPADLAERQSAQARAYWWYGPHGAIEYRPSSWPHHWRVGVSDPAEGPESFRLYGSGATPAEAFEDAFADGYPFGYRPKWDRHPHPKEIVH